MHPEPLHGLPGEHREGQPHGPQRLKYINYIIVYFSTNCLPIWLKFSSCGQCGMCDKYVGVVCVVFAVGVVICGNLW